MADPAAGHDLAIPVLGGVVQGAFDDAMTAVWSFAGNLLTTAFNLVDKFTTPNVDPTHGPISGVVPTTMWVAGIVAVLTAFVQVARGAITRGHGIGTLLMGLGQYALVNAAAYTVLAAMVAACSGVTATILTNALHVSTWSGLNANNGVLLAAAQGQSGVQLGLLAVICVIPAAFGYMVEMLVRDAALLILAATIPILAAGLLAEKTASWFWRGLRWIIALLVLQPATAVVIAVGFNIAAAAEGAGTGSSSSQAQGLATLAVGGLTLLISLLCPLALFKLLAFVEPGTPSGQAFRGSVTGLRNSAPAARPAAGGGGGAGAAGAASGEAATTGRFAAALSKAGPAAGAVGVAATAAFSVGQRVAGMADNVLASAGAGHHLPSQGRTTIAVPASSGGASGTARPSGRRSAVPGPPPGAPPPGGAQASAKGTGAALGLPAGRSDQQLHGVGARASYPTADVPARVDDPEERS